MVPTKIEVISPITVVITVKVTGVNVLKVQGHTKVGAVQSPVTVPTLVLQPVVVLRVEVEGPHSKVVLVYLLRPRLIQQLM